MRRHIDRVFDVDEAVITRDRDGTIAIRFPQSRKVEGLDLTGRWSINATHRDHYISIMIEERNEDFDPTGKAIQILAHRAVFQQEDD